MNLLDFGDRGFISWGSVYVNGRIEGIGFDLGWYWHRIELTLFSLTLFEWAEDASYLRIIRLQVLYFLFFVSLGRD